MPLLALAWGGENDYLFRKSEETLAQFREKILIIK
jgi:hypothetical protein